MTVKKYAVFASNSQNRYVGIDGLIGFADTIEGAKNLFSEGYFPDHPAFGVESYLGRTDYEEDDWRGFEHGEIVETKSWRKVAVLIGDYYTKGGTQMLLE
jgi:hypothetical protein